MGALKVYSSDGLTVRAELSKYQYNGTFMGERTVTASVSSPSAIQFAVGDYVTVRGQKFRIYTIPSVKKQARRGAYGAGYVYDSITFHSALQDLVVVKFKDYVLNDSKLHYSGLDTFSFYMTRINDLGDRILANIGRVYGSDVWQIIYAKEDVLDDSGMVIVHGTGKDFAIKSQSISISTGTSLHDALNLYNSTFDLDYIFTEIGGKHTIIIGGRPLIDGDDLSYGKGRGLLSLQRTRNDSDAVITRLHAYGSTRNLPYRYYNKKYSDIPSGMYINKLMLPHDLWVKESDVWDAYIDSDNKDRYGLREADVTFDGTDEKWNEVYPSVEGMSLNDIKPGMTGYSDGWTEESASEHEYSITQAQIDACNGYTYDGAYRLDEATMGSGDATSPEPVEDNGVSADGTYEDGSLDTDGNVMHTDFYLRIPQLFFNLSDFVNSTETPTLNMKSGMCAGRSFEILSSYEDDTVEKIGDCAPRGYLLHLKRDDSDVSAVNMIYPNTSFQIESGDEFVITGINMPGIYVESAEQRLYALAIEYLSEYDHENYTYVPRIDNIYLSNHEDLAVQLFEGMQLPFNDSDSTDAGVTGDIGIGRKTVSIKQITIKYNDGALPHYEVTLDESIDSISLQDVVNTQIKRAASTGILGNDVTKLSKIEDDTAHGKITFEQGFIVNDAYGSDKSGNFKVNTLDVGSSAVVDGSVEVYGTEDDPLLTVGGTEGEVSFGTFSKSVSGGMIDRNGDSELNSLVLRESLVVPKITYNNEEWIGGNTWRSQGGGIIKRVATVDNEDGTQTHYAILDIKADEGGKCRAGDKCQGIYHMREEAGQDPDDNATEDTDDHNGHFTFKGFATIYFLITRVYGCTTDVESEYYTTAKERKAIMEAFGAYNIPAYIVNRNGDNIVNDNGEYIINTDAHFMPEEIEEMVDEAIALNGVIKFKTRAEVDSTYTSNILPPPQLSFAEYANEYDASRQWVTLTTPSYEVCLKDMKGWTYDQSNIQYIRGSLDGFSIAKRKWDAESGTWVDDGILYLTGMGIAFGNAYMWGSLTQFDRTPSLVTQKLYRKALPDATGVTREMIGTSTDSEATEENPYLWAYWEYTDSEGGVTYSDVFLSANYSKEGDSGAVIRPCGEWSSEKTYVSNSEWIDVVVYNGAYYRCRVTNSGVTPTDTDYWEVADMMDFVATDLLLSSIIETKVLQAVNAMVGSLYLNKAYAAPLIDDGSGNKIPDASNPTIKIDGETGAITTKSILSQATYSPWVDFDESGEHDNRYGQDEVPLTNEFVLPNGAENAGRVFRISSCPLESYTADSNAELSIDASDGVQRYFYEDGLRKTGLELSNEFAELVGIGSADKLIGYIVLTRTNFTTVKRYGAPWNPLAFGIIGYENGEISNDIRMFDQGDHTVDKETSIQLSYTSPGICKLYFPTSWFSDEDDMFVMVSGYGAYNMKACVKAYTRSTDYSDYQWCVEIGLSDDSTLNDGYFQFMVFNRKDWNSRRY